MTGSWRPWTTGTSEFAEIFEAFYQDGLVSSLVWHHDPGSANETRRVTEVDQTRGPSRRSLNNAWLDVSVERLRRLNMNWKLRLGNVN